MEMILFCNLLCVYVHKICDDKYGHDADDSSTDLCADDAASRQDISTPFSILNEFEATEYSYSIRYSIRIRIFEDIRFEWNSRFVPSLTTTLHI